MFKLLLVCSLAFSAKLPHKFYKHVEENSESKEKVRILIDTSGNLTFNVFDPLITAKSGQNNRYYGNRKISVRLKNGYFLVNDGTAIRKIQGDSLNVKSISNYLKYKGLPYDGEFEVKSFNKVMQLIYLVSIEKYLQGRLIKEMKPSWEINALKAQIVLLRTDLVKNMFKSRQKKMSYDLKSDFMEFFYIEEPSLNNKIVKAIKETESEVLVFKNRFHEVPFHSTCGGKTEFASNVWGESINSDIGLFSVKCPYCENSPHYVWKLSFTREKLAEILRNNGFSVSKIKNVYVNKITSTDRVERLNIVLSGHSIYISALKFREIIGKDKFLSTKFSISSDDKFITIIGKGSGHGVGMCQWGARTLAKKGYGYKSILMTYFPESSIKNFNYYGNI